MTVRTPGSLTFVLLAALVLPIQPPVVIPQRAGPDAPVDDPITMRGCLEGRHLRILEQDSSDLSGVHDIRLKGARGVMRLVDDADHRYVELTGVLRLGRRDRVDTRRKVKAGKTTIYVSGAAEQTSGETPVADPVFEVQALTPLGERCPGR
jgi:hypothetical protein